MPRFTDEWLTDRVLIDYVSGGACACCGLQHLFLPNGIEDLIQAVSDLETDQAKQAAQEDDHGPWPEVLRSQVWADRVKLRQKLKTHLPQYEAFWKEYGDEFRTWFGSTEQNTHHRRFFQLSRYEIMELVREKYDIHSAFGVLLCGILEQVAHYELTAYPPDGRGAPELNFEAALKYDRRGGFTLDMDQTDDEEGMMMDWQEMWLERMRTLGGPKLLQRGKSSSTTTTSSGSSAKDGGGADDVETAPENKSSAGFSSDRRIARLLIARHWADLLQKRFLDEKAKEDVV